MASTARTGKYTPSQSPQPKDLPNDKERQEVCQKFAQLGLYPEQPQTPQHTTQQPTPTPSPSKHPHHLPWLTSNIIDSAPLTHISLDRRDEYHLGLLAIQTHRDFANMALMDQLKELSAVFYREAGLEGQVCCMWSEDERRILSEYFARDVTEMTDKQRKRELDELEALYQAKKAEYTEVNPFSGDCRGISWKG